MKKNVDPEILRRRRFSLISIGALVVVFVLVAWLVGKPIVAFVTRGEDFHLWINQNRLLGHLFIVGVQALQDLIAIIPGEPFEIAAGYAYGWFGGMLLCMAGSSIGTAIAFFLARRYGIRLVEAFVPREKIASLRFIRKKKQLDFLVFLLYFIPGTPKGFITYALGMTPIKWLPFMLISTFARIPSIVTSTIAGSTAEKENWTVTVITLIVAGLMALGGGIYYKIVTDRENKKDCGPAPKE